MLEILLGVFVVAMLAVLIVTIQKVKPEKVEEVLSSSFVANTLIVLLIVILVLIFLQRADAKDWAPDLIKVVVGVLVGVAGVSVGRDAIITMVSGNNNLINNKIDEFKADIKKFEGSLSNIKSLVMQASTHSDEVVYVPFNNHLFSHEIALKALETTSFSFDELARDCKAAFQSPQQTLDTLDTEDIGKGFFSLYAIDDSDNILKQNARELAIYRWPPFRAHIAEFSRRAANAGMSCEIMKVSVFGFGLRSGELEEDATVRLDFRMRYLMQTPGNLAT